MKKFVYFLLALSFFFLLVSLLGLYLNSRILQSEEFYASANITNRVLGIDLNASALTFGYVARGGTVERSIIFSNKYEFPVTVEIKAEGDISELLSFDSPVRIEEGEEEKKIAFTLSAPREIREGFYDGSVKLDIKPA